MKPAAFDHVAPTSLSEALRLIELHGAEAKVLAGGQRLVPVLALRLASPSWLIDLNHIPSLNGIERLESGALRIGAMTTHRAIERSDIVAHANPLLSTAMQWVAHVQIRNRGTIGGSLSHADPAAELPAICLASDAIIVAKSLNGERKIRSSEFFKGMFETDLSNDELLVEIRFPVWPHGRRYGFVEIARRHGDFAICGVALILDCDELQKIIACRIVAFGVADKPIRLDSAERILQGKSITDLKASSIDFVSEAAIDKLVPRSDHHASAEYRLELVHVLTARALSQALLG